jgi:predicted RNA binding protein YcfA (HicA-like mRNA interferase family)
MSDEIKSKHHSVLNKIIVGASVVVGIITLAGAYAALNMKLEADAIMEGERMLGKASFELRKQVMDFHHTQPLSDFPSMLVHTKFGKRKWYRLHTDLEYAIEFRKTGRAPMSLGHPESKFRRALQAAKSGDLTDFLDVEMHPRAVRWRKQSLEQYGLAKKQSRVFSGHVNKVVNKLERTPDSELDRREAELFPQAQKKVERSTGLSRMDKPTTTPEERQSLLPKKTPPPSPSYDDPPVGDSLKAYHRRMSKSLSKSFSVEGGGGGGGGDVTVTPKGPRTYEILNPRANAIYENIKDRGYSNITAGEVQEFLKKENWTFEKVDGSHFWYSKNGVRVKVPRHAAEPIARGTCRQIFMDIGVIDR